MLFQQTKLTLGFKQWLLQDLENRRVLWLSAAASVFMFIGIKLIFPYPNFMPPDSNAYLEAAYNNQFIGVWAIGYSKFLRLFSSFSSSSIALVCFQYLILQVSLLYLLFSIRYLMSPGVWVFRVMWAASILNPLLPHVANYVSSDAIFTALSLVWFTQLLWIVHRPTIRLLLQHAAILLLAFTVRYNALYFPIISVLVILLSSLPIMKKTLGVASILLLLGTFIIRTQYEYQRETGKSQFSAFGGWQIAANALYGYAHTKPDSPETVPEKFRSLHALVNQRTASLRHIPNFLRPDSNVGVYYLWDLQSPLRVYMTQQYKAKDSIISTNYIFFKRWAPMAPLYAAYGRYLICHHPWPFIKFYVWPNLIKYYAPPTGFMGFYNLGNDHVDPIVVKWFHWKNNAVSSSFKDQRIEIFDIFPIMFSVVNLVFILSFLSFAALGGFSKCAPMNKRILYWMLIIWLCNMVFSVLAAPIELRYQLFPMVITFCFSLLLLSFVLVQSRSKQPDTSGFIRANSPPSQLPVH